MPGRKAALDTGPGSHRSGRRTPLAPTTARGTADPSRSRHPSRMRTRKRTDRSRPGQFPNTTLLARSRSCARRWPAPPDTPPGPAARMSRRASRGFSMYPRSPPHSLAGRGGSADVDRACGAAHLSTRQPHVIVSPATGRVDGLDGSRLPVSSPGAEVSAVAHVDPHCISHVHRRRRFRAKDSFVKTSSWPSLMWATTLTT